MKFYPQYDQMDCGPACLRMVANYYGKEYSLKFIRDNTFITKEGTSMLGIAEAAKKIGLEYMAAETTVDYFKTNQFSPCILYWGANHFVVLSKINKLKKRFVKGYSIKVKHEWEFKIADPGHGIRKMSESEFIGYWIAKESDKGFVMFFGPGDTFSDINEERIEKSIVKHLFSYIKPFKSKFYQLFVCFFFSSGITILLPFFTKQLMDQGVLQKNIQVVYLILIAQFFLFLGSAVIDVINSRITLFLSTKVNISITSEYLGKLLRLPIKFFDSRLVGDLIERVNDQERIERFLTSQSVFTIFSILNFFVFFIVLAYFNITILFCYLVLTILAVFWYFLFNKKRNHLDYQRFRVRSENLERRYELLTSMQEIKLNGLEEYKKKQWESIQEKIFKINLRILDIEQKQSSGFRFINNLKNIFVTFIAANEVINNRLTIGAMLSIAYIIGEMNSPISQLLSFFRSWQDAKISIHRMIEIQNEDDEENLEDINQYISPIDNKTLNDNGILINNLSFRYGGPKSPWVLKEINVLLPKGQTTAIVGESGSGKTTLLKLLLKFYVPTEGCVEVENIQLTNFSATSWRAKCGVVMQDGVIFSETIARNIATNDEFIDVIKLNYAIKTASLTDFVANLPLGAETKIGAAGIEISGGQRQRILIARTVYKDPEYLFFDEATSSLDANNERLIMSNLDEFSKGKTVLVIAHRLSTVKSADQIIVLEKGKIVELGSHTTLTNIKGKYFNLVRNQLELGS